VFVIGPAAVGKMTVGMERTAHRVEHRRAAYALLVLGGR